MSMFKISLFLTKKMPRLKAARVKSYLRSSTRTKNHARSPCQQITGCSRSERAFDVSAVEWIDIILEVVEFLFHDKQNSTSSEGFVNRFYEGRTSEIIGCVEIP